jgi:glutaredoxin 3
MPEITIYTTEFCGYCARVRALLKRKGAAFHEIDVGHDPDLRRDMTTKAGGRRTVPQVFIGGSHVGGSDDLHALDAAGKLDVLLAP